MSIPEKDLKILWGKAAGRCAFTECRGQRLIHEASEEVPSKNILIGENCHIVAEEEGGPRGCSILTKDERNRYPNLILLCVKHHTIIDQDPTSWPVEKLHQIKSDHEIWVENVFADRSESGNIAFEVYSDLINTATECLLLEQWEWVSDHCLRLLVPEAFINGIDFYWNKVQRTLWPGQISDLESAINNLCNRLSLFSKYFLRNATLSDPTTTKEGFFIEDKWWKRQWRSDYHIYLEKSNKWQKQCTELLFNVVVALNTFADSVRKYIKPNYLILQGKFVIPDDLGVLGNAMDAAIYMPDKYIEVEGLSE